MKLSELGGLKWYKVQYSEGGKSVYLWREGFEHWHPHGMCKDLQGVCDFLNQDSDDHIAVTDIEDDLPLIENWKDVEW